jgi:predicted DNA-binding protein with PD1-like motif
MSCLALLWIGTQRAFTNDAGKYLTHSLQAVEEELMAKAFCILVLIGVTTMMSFFAGDGNRLRRAVASCSEGQSSEDAGSIAEPGRKLLNPGEKTKQYAVIFYQGDEAFSGLLEFAEKYHVTSAHFAAIGALNGATVGWFDSQRKMYKKIPIEGQVEVLSMIGDIALYQGKPVVHMHMVVGTSDGTTRGGHVLGAYASPTLEVMLTVDPATMQKRFDPATDLTLIDPGLK